MAEGKRYDPAEQIPITLTRKEWEIVEESLRNDVGHAQAVIWENRHNAGLPGMGSNYRQQCEERVGEYSAWLHQLEQLMEHIDDVLHPKAEFPDD